MFPRSHFSNGYFEPMFVKETFQRYYKKKILSATDLFLCSLKFISKDDTKNYICLNIFLSPFWIVSKGLK